MSGIFISHSSSDDSVAAEVKRWLVDQGHRSVFLDFDPEAGIPAGRSWEQELYQQLRSCRAVVVLCSEQSMASRWCFAEITHARSLGKPVFPIKIGPCTVDSVLTDRQVLDFTRDRDEAFRRLGQGLTLAGVDACNPFDWDASRPPYPGLLTFGEGDAAIFFGRDREIGEGLDLLQQMRRFGGTSLLLLLGSSGSGKSSLLRAGLVPRLRRDPAQWLIVEPWRPGENPRAQAAMALSRSYQLCGQDREWSRLEERLAADQEEEGAAWVATVRDLLHAAGRPEATVLLFVDQFEELLGHAPEHPANSFLRGLRAALASPACPLLVVATLRSDYLGTFQRHPALDDLPFRSLSLGPLSIEGLSDIILKPAALAGLNVEPGLVQALLVDTEAEDALPLLAFTLRELYELARQERGGLGVHAYRQRLGGLQGSVARAADAVVSSQKLGDAEAEALRSAFLGMVRLDEEGHFLRRVLGWRQLSPEAHAWLERFVAARLVVARGDGKERTVEVAHEALFRAWGLLAHWLEENREALALRHELSLAIKLWEKDGRREEDLWRGGRLGRALELLDTSREGREQPAQGPRRGERLPIAPLELEFLEAAEKAERHRQRQRQVRWLSGVAAALLVAAIMSVLFLQARYQRDRARTQTLAVESRLAQPDHLDRALLLALEIGRRGDRFEAGRLLYQGLESSPRLERLLRGHRDDVRAVAWSPDGRLLATAAGAEPALLLWDVAATDPTPRALAGAGGALWGLDWSPDGRLLAAAGAEGSVWLWDLDAPDKGPRRLTDPRRPARELFAVRFSPGGDRLAAARSDHLVELWDVAFGQPLSLLAGAEDQLRAVAWSPDGTTLAAAGMDRLVRLWTVATGAAIEPALAGHTEGVMSLGWSPDGTLLASASLDGTVGLWDRASAPGAEHHQRLYPLIGPLTSLAWAADSPTLALGAGDGRLAIWELGDARRRRPLGPSAGGQVGALLAVAWSPDGRRLASGNGSVVALWDAASGPRLGQRVELGAGELRAVAASADGLTLAAQGREALSGELALRLWDLESGRLRGVMRGELPDDGGRPPSLAWSPDGRYLFTANTGREVRRLEASSGRILDAWQAAGGGQSRWTRLAWSPGGTRLAAAGTGGEVEVWDARSRRQRAPSEPRAETRRAEESSSPGGAGRPRVSALAWSPDGRRLATGDAGGGLWLWDGEGDRHLAGRLAEPGGSAARPRTGLSPTEQPPAAAGRGAEVIALAWSPDGQTLAVAGRDRSLRLWQAGAGKARALALVEPGASGMAPVIALAWGPDGRTLAGATLDRQILLWDTARRQLLAGPLRGHRDTITALFFDPPGRVLSSVGIDGELWRWDVDFDSWRERACRLSGRDLGAEERRLFLIDAAGPPLCPAERPAAARRMHS